MRRQPRRNYRARYGPHPRAIGRRAITAEDATDGALAVQHIVVVGSTGADAAVAGAAEL
jgi:hypothetical protein